MKFIMNLIFILIGTALLMYNIDHIIERYRDPMKMMQSENAFWPILRLLTVIYWICITFLNVEV